ERPALWRSLSERQLFLVKLTIVPVGAGPALTVSTAVPDMASFRGSYGGKDVMPLFRDQACTQPNVAQGTLEVIGARLRDAHPRVPNPTVEDLAAYVYGLLSLPAYQKRFAAPLADRVLRVPITAEPELF